MNWQIVGGCIGMGLSVGSFIVDRVVLQQKSIEPVIMLGGSIMLLVIGILMLHST